MRRQGNTSAIPVIDLEASNLCKQDVDVGALNHGAVIKYRLAGTYHMKALIQLVDEVLMLVQLPVGRALDVTGDLSRRCRRPIRMQEDRPHIPTLFQR